MNERDLVGGTLKDRVGKIYVPDDDDWVHGNVTMRNGCVWPVLEWLEFVPLRVEHLAHRRAYEYIGTSPHFSLVEPGHTVPEYQVEITTYPSDEDSGGRFEFDLQRVGEIWLRSEPNDLITA